MTTLNAGTTIEFSVDDGSTFVSLLGVPETPDFRDEKEEVENTTITDTTRQYRPGLDSPTEVTLTAHYLRTDTDQLAFRALARSNGSCIMKITDPDGEELQFPCELKNYGINGGDAAAIKMWSCDVRRTAAITFTESAA